MIDFHLVLAFFGVSNKERKRDRLSGTILKELQVFYGINKSFLVLLFAQICPSPDYFDVKYNNIFLVDSHELFGLKKIDA